MNTPVPGNLGVNHELGQLLGPVHAERLEPVAGAVPAQVPARPTGIERNVVATVRDWSSPQFYMHDLSGTDRRNPTVNGYGPLYGAPELSTDGNAHPRPGGQHGDCLQGSGP